MKDKVSYLDMAAGVNLLTESAVRTAIRTLQLPVASQGLDAGCGLGTHARWLAEATAPGSHITGVDISQESLSRAEKVSGKNDLSADVSFQYGDMTRLLFDNDAFDWAWSSDTLWPVGDKNPLSMLGELVRVVKPLGVVAILFWSSQRLMPGYPILEARLNATCAANFPYTDDTSPELHILRALDWIREAGLEDFKVQTFVADIHTPVDNTVRDALTGIFQMLWGKAKPEVRPEDWAQFQRLCQPQSPDFILNMPNYYAFITHSLFWGRVAGSTRE